jgi:hypothetical protein
MMMMCRFMCSHSHCSQAASAEEQRERVRTTGGFHGDRLTNGFFQFLLSAISDTPDTLVDGNYVSARQVFNLYPHASPHNLASIFAILFNLEPGKDGLAFDRIVKLSEFAFSFNDTSEEQHDGLLRSILESEVFDDPAPTEVSASFPIIAAMYTVRRRRREAFCVRGPCRQARCCQGAFVDWPESSVV